MARYPKFLNTKVLEDRLRKWIYSRGLASVASKYTIDQYETMLRQDPVSSVANRALIQGTIAMLGKYQHDDPKIQEFGREAIANFQGSLTTFWELCLSYVSHGAVVAHMKHILRDKQYWFDVFTFIPLDAITWKITNQQITDLKVKGVLNEVPYKHIFHLMNEAAITPGKVRPLGCAVCEKAYKYWELEELLFTTVGTIGQKQSSKLLVGKVPDTDAPIILDEDDIDPVTGTPRETTSGEQMKLVLEETENQSVVICEVGDEIDAVDQTIDGAFFDFIFHYLSTQRFLCFYQAQTGFSGNKSGVGDAGLADSQKETFLSFQEAKAKYLGDEFISQGLTPLIDANFGKQGNYGYFATNKQDPKALEIAKLIIQILASEGVVTEAVDRTSAYEKLKELVGF